MANLSISRAWDETKAIIARDGKLILPVALALIVLPQVVAGLVSPSTTANTEPSRSEFLIMVVAALIGIVGQLALIRLALGPALSVGEAIAHGARRFLPAFLALLLFGLLLVLIMVPVVLVVLGTGGTDFVRTTSVTPSPAMGGLVLLLLVLIIVLAARIMLLMPVASAEPLGPVAILKRSWALSKGNYWRLLGFLLLVLVLAMVVLYVAQVIGGLLATLIGGEVEPMSLAALILALMVSLAQGAFSVVSSVMLARIYVQLASGDAEVSVPSSSAA